MPSGRILIYGAAFAVVLGGLVSAKWYSGSRARTPPEEPSAMAEKQEASASGESAAERTGRPSAVMMTNYGDIMLELFAEDAPRTVENFVKLSRSGFYDGVKFHRVIKGFMIQGGDPQSKDNDWSDDGRGGPGYTFPDEINAQKIVRGTLAMANSGPDTNGSQFFIVTAEAAPWLDGKHTAFGRVVSGMETVTKIENVPADQSRGDHPITDAVITDIEITSAR